MFKFFNVLVKPFEQRYDANCDRMKSRCHYYFFNNKEIKLRNNEFKKIKKSKKKSMQCN